MSTIEKQSDVLTTIATDDVAPVDLPVPRYEDEEFEPTIVRGRE